MKSLIILVCVLGGCVAQSLAQKGNAKHAAWSPDGKSIAFSLETKGGYDIYVMDKDGANAKQITSMEGDELWPSWMGDSVLVFDGAGSKENQDIYRVRLSDKSLTRLTDDIAFDAVADVGNVTGRILFDANRSIDKLADVWVMDRDGKNQQQLTKGANSYGHGVWSGDETKIAFKTRISEKVEDIHIMNGDGSEVQRVTDLRAVSRQPSWSKDGNKLVFSSNAAGVFALYVYDFTTSRITQVAFTRGANLHRPSFSSDGNFILYTEEKNKRWQIRLLDLKTGVMRTIVSN